MAQQRLVEAVKKHNELLAVKVNELRQNYPQVQWILFDAFKEVSRIMDEPEKYGFNNVLTPCYSFEVEKKSSRKFLKSLARIPPENVDSSCEGDLFFDSVHPTFPAHQLIASHIKIYLEKYGFVFSEK